MTIYLKLKLNIPYYAFYLTIKLGSKSFKVFNTSMVLFGVELRKLRRVEEEKVEIKKIEKKSYLGKSAGVHAPLSSLV